MAPNHDQPKYYPDEASVADPAAVDLDEIKANWDRPPRCIPMPVDVKTLIAAVEALRALGVELEKLAEAAEECVTMLRRLVDLSRRENWPTNADFEPAEDALAKLDALGKEEG